MSRYIDADALKAFIRNRYFQCDMPEEWGNGVMWATSQINYYCNKEAPSIDIVRCKECQGYTPNTKPQTDEHLQRLQMCVDCEHTDMCEWCSRWSKDEPQTEREGE